MHFYEDNNGVVEPRHFVPMAKDPTRTRASRVTDARKAAKEGKTWYPSVTTVLNILDKPALVSWKVDKHLEQAINFSHIQDIEEYKKAVKSATQEALDAAPKAGTDIHKVLEDHLDSDDLSDLPEVEQLIVKNVRQALTDNCGGYKGFSKEQYFINKEHGYAGCADLADNIWVIDYKSKQEASKFKPGKMAYPEHVRQLSSYSQALIPEHSFLTKKCANIFICLENGEVDFHEHEQAKLENGWLDFIDCLNIYKRNTYNPLEK